MCQGVISPLPVKLAKITVVVVFFCFAECAAGSCLSYGHACWGAHGKRNGPHTNIPDKEPLGKPSGWYLSRLVRGPLDLRYVNERDLELPTNRQFFPDTQMEAETLKSQDDPRTLQEEEVLVDDTYPIQRPRFNRLKFPRVKNSRDDFEEHV